MEADLWTSVNQSDNVSPSLPGYGSVIPSSEPYAVPSPIPSSTPTSVYSPPVGSTPPAGGLSEYEKRLLRLQERQIDAAENASFLSYMGQMHTNTINMAMNRAYEAWQREENETARKREDNAVQRRARDLEIAGLSKTLSAGNSASAQAMNAVQGRHAWVNPYADSGRLAIDALQAVANVRYTESLTNLNNIDAETRAQSNIANLRISEARAVLEETAGFKAVATLDDEIAKVKLDNLKTEKDIQLISEKIVEQQIHNKMLSFEQKTQAISYVFNMLTSGLSAFKGTSYLPISSTSRSISSSSNFNYHM